MIEDKFRSIIPQYRRDPITKEIISQPRSEQITVNPVNPVYVTAELIDEYFRVIIQDMSSQYLIEVFNFDDISEGHFYVNYTSRKIYFDNASIGVKYTIYYNGMGGEFVDASLISTQIDTAGDVVQTLQDILTGDSIGNLNESWGRVTYIQPSNNILQLTRNRRQYIVNGTLLTGTTIKLPTMELGDYLQLTLMFYADSNLSLVFEDENIKWSNQPFIQIGRSYTFTFEYVDGTWYCEWVKLERYLKDYIYKVGDTCVALTGGYNYTSRQWDWSGSDWSGAIYPNVGGKISLYSAISTRHNYDQTATTINSIDLTDYKYIYIDLETIGSIGINGDIYSQILIGNTVIYSSINLTRQIIKIDIGAFDGNHKIIYKTHSYYNPYTVTLNIYNVWLEKNEFTDTSQEIFTTSEKNKLSSISANANKVIDSTINGNILIDGVETNVYTHPIGTNPHNTTKTDIELGNVDNTSDLNKPISTATQIALDRKVDDSQVLTNVPVGALFTDTTYDLFSSTADGLVPLSGGGITKYLRADGTWVVPSDTNTTYEVATTSANGLMSSVDKTKLDGIETNANNYVHPVNHLPSVITQDSTNRFVTDIEKASWNGKAETSIATTLVNGLMSATDKTKLDTIESNAEVNNISDINATDLTDTGDTILHYHSTDRNRTNHTGTQLASTISDFASTVRGIVLTGLSTTTNAIISATDTVLGALGKLQKQVSDNLATLTSHIGNVSNPHSVTKTQVDLGNVDNTTDLLKPISTATQSALDLKISSSQKGVSNGVAQLDANGLVPSSQLPSYVNDILEYTSNALFPATGEAGIIYLNTTTNLTYRWSGTGYAEVSPSIALGETSSTAYAGDKGATTTSNLNNHTGNSTTHITSTERTNWNSASTNNHTHTNKTVIDNTTAPYTTAEQAKLSGIANNANNYTLPVASTVIGGVKGGTDITVDASGNVSVVDDSHNHIISNIDGLQTALDGKVDDSQVLTNVPINAVFTDTVYTHPTNHAPSIIIQDSSNRFVTDVEKATWNGKATPSNITDSINAIQIGGRNLIKNSQYVTVEGNSIDKGTGVLMLNETIPYYRVTGETSITTYGFDGSSSASQFSKFMEVGQTYTVSVDVRIPVLGNVSFYNSRGNMSVGVINKWVRISYTYVYSEGYRIIGNVYNSANTLDYRNWKIEVGNKATDWTSAPEDVDSAIALKADKITSGTTAQRPIPTYIGQAYFDTDLGKQINAKTLNPVVWVDGIGTVV